VTRSESSQGPSAPALAAGTQRGEGPTGSSGSGDAAPGTASTETTRPFATLTGVAYGSSGDPGQITISPRTPGGLGCTSAPGEPGSSCAVRWPAIQRLFSEAPVGYAGAGTAGALAVGRGGGPPGGGHGGAAYETPPMTPGPGPAPSGAAGGAAVGGAGVAPTAFLALVGLLLLAAPHVLRRLRLSTVPWRTAFFVLIPERPG